MLKSAQEENTMKSRIIIIFVLVMLLLAAVSCDKKSKTTTESLPVSQALSTYWTTQEGLTGALEARDSTMLQIKNHIDALGSKSGRDAYTDIDNLVNLYVLQSDAAATEFDKLIRLENAIIPYGTTNKGIFSSLANGIYTKAKSTVVGSAHLVRSGWRVMSGSKSLRQVLRDPESGIPIVSDFAEKMQQSNSARDAAIREAILANNSHEGAVPIEDLPGTTMQEKLNNYLNLDEDDPVKLGTRRRVMEWDEADRTRTANTAKELGETGVKIVGDAYGGAPGEWANEVLNQHMSEGQNTTNSGTCNLTVNQDSESNPAITAPKTIIISKKNMPDEDPRITIVMNAPQNLVQPLPNGDYSVIVMAEGFIRNVQEDLQIAQTQVNNVMAKLLKLADNAIVIESMTANPETVFLGDLATIDVSCVSTIGQALTFTWDVAGGTFINKSATRTQLKFKPTQEGIYTVTVTIEDALGNEKVKSVQVHVVDAALTVGQYTITGENISDSKVNPGETVTMSLPVTNNMTTNLVGTIHFTGENGITIDYTSSRVVLYPGENLISGINVQLPVNYSEDTGTINFLCDTFDGNNNPVTIGAPVEFPVEFYVEINDITTDPVTDRVVYISGRVANPQLSTAILFFDNDFEQPTNLNLSSGSFSQQIALSGSATEVEHTVKVIGISGGNVAEDVMTFNSLVPLTALRMTLSWDTPGTDVDFWCTDPNGEKCYYGHTSTLSGLELDFDDTNGYGPENITTTTIIPGDYLVQVHYYSDHDGTNAIYSNCQVVIRQNEGTTNETINNYYGGLSDTGDIWTVTTLTYAAGKWSVKPSNNRHSYQDPKLLPKK